MIELNINNLTKYYGANRIFQDISFEIQTGERIGLIGPNGCGKTTIMKILMGTEDYQGGTISFRKDTKVGYLNQIPQFEEGMTTSDVLQMAFEEIYIVQKQMEELEQLLCRLEGGELDKAILNYSRLQEQYEHKGGYDTETKLNKITEGLGITEVMMNMQFDSLSGGEKTRVILAKILLEEPDILLLDEPTNHLDLMTIEWLEKFLESYRGAALIVSHDRFFLDSVVNKIVEMQFDHADIYLGNYSYYVVEKERRFLLELKYYQNQQKKIDRMEQQIERYRIWGEMRDSDKMFRRAKELEKRLEKIEVMKRPVLEHKKIRLSQIAAGRSGRVVLETSDLAKSYGSRTILKDISITLFYQDNACIIGENGCGKTTLLKMILGELEPDRGDVKLGSQVIIGYLPQQVEYEDEEQTVLEYFSRLHNVTYSMARNQLAKVLFTNDDVYKKIKSLSGGEKSRLRLCSLTFTGVNFLILDEPTNHLDIDSREVLEDMLSEFQGTILFVSHDRYFIHKIADKIITIEDSVLREYNGDYLYYQEELKKQQERLIVLSLGKEGNKAGNNSENARERGGRGIITDTANRIGTNKEVMTAKTLESLEKNIEEIEAKLKQLEELMDRYSTDEYRLSEIYLEKVQTVKELEDAYLKWEDLQYQKS